MNETTTLPIETSLFRKMMRHLPWFGHITDSAVDEIVRYLEYEKLPLSADFMKRVVTYDNRSQMVRLMQEEEKRQLDWALACYLCAQQGYDVLSPDFNTVVVIERQK